MMYLINKQVLRRDFKYVFIELIIILLILLWGYTAASKILDIHGFRMVLSKSPLINPVSNLVSWLVPLFEIFTVLLLIIPSSRKFGLLFSIILLSVFVIYIIYMKLFIPHLPCSCGGLIKEMSWSQHLVFNIGFITLSCIGLWLIKRVHFIAISRQSRTPV